MTALRSILSATLVAAALAGSVAASTTSAEAGGLRNFGGGLAVGAIGGLILGGALAQPSYAEPVAVYVEPAYQPAYVPRCHSEWRTDYYGNAVKVKVCN